jgi:hypothetical protein
LKIDGAIAPDRPQWNLILMLKLSFRACIHKQPGWSRPHLSPSIVYDAKAVTV